MQDIKKQCDKCKTKDTVKKTLEDPKPESIIENVKIPGRGKSLDPTNMDLCKPCHLEIAILILKWLGGVSSLDDF